MSDTHGVNGEGWVGFDLDGTLLYTLEDLYLATNHALKAMGLPSAMRFADT